MINANIIKIAKKKFSLDTIFNIASLALISFIGILINIIIGNSYGPSDLGIYNLTFSLYILLSTLSIFGLKASVLKHTAQFNKHPSKRDSSLTAALISTTTISLFICLTYIILINRNIIQSHSGFFINILIALPLFSINEVFFGYINGIREMKLYAITRTLRWVLIFFGIGINAIFNYTFGRLFYSYF